MIPVFVLTEDVVLPETGTYYIVTQEGVFLHKETGLVSATVRVSGIPFLGKLTPRAQLHLPRLSSILLARTWLFFRAIHRRMNSEAVVLLHYSVKTGEFLLHCPEQKVSAGGLDYDPTERFEGYQLVGSIHSHNTFDAFHSGTDTHDEMDFDGLHITIGKLNQPFFTISCSIAVNNNRFVVAPEEIAEGIIPVDWKPDPQIVYVRKPKVDAKPQGNGVLGSVVRFFTGPLDELDEPAKEPVVVPDRNQYYDVMLPAGLTFRNVRFPRAWYKQVTRRVYQKAPEDSGVVFPIQPLPNGVGNTGEQLVAQFQASGGWDEL